MNSESESDEENGIWDFKAVRRLRRAFNHPQFQSNDSHNREDLPDFLKYDPKCHAPKGLGDFDRLMSFCGKPIETTDSCNYVTDSSSSQQSSDRATPPSSVSEDNLLHKAEHFDDFVSRSSRTGKTVQWEDEAGGDQELTKLRMRTGHDSAAQLDIAKVAQLVDLPSESDTDSDPEATGTPTPSPRSIRTLKRRAGQSLKSTRGDRPGNSLKSALVTRTVTPKTNGLFTLYDEKPPPAILSFYRDPKVVQPIFTLTNNEQKAKLIKKLSKRLCTSGEDYGQAVEKLGGSTDSDGIHVFVDLSNINIGYQDQIKMNRSIPIPRHIHNPPMSFSSLALILERGRKVARRVLAGSTLSVVYGETRKLHRHITDAKDCGYELNILERVSKPLPSTKVIKKKHGTGSGYATSGNSSASESGQNPRRLKMQEQAVDELLQMKMLESIVDTETPTTLVLASGDAAEAEFSGGFLRNVERALSKGWKVEVVAWRKGLSYEYRSSRLLRKWGKKLTIIELDDFCEEMLALYTPKFTQHLVPGANGMCFTQLRVVGH